MSHKHACLPALYELGLWKISSCASWKIISDYFLCKSSTIPMVLLGILLENYLSSEYYFKWSCYWLALAHAQPYVKRRITKESQSRRLLIHDFNNLQQSTLTLTIRTENVAKWKLTTHQELYLSCVYRGK